MDPEAELQLAEQLLVSELNNLESYNRLLEQGQRIPLADLVEQFRDEEVVRIEELQQRIRLYRDQLEA